jgi:hypothetical protein
MNPDLIQYIRQNRDIYTREAIDRQLLNAGYNPADVEAAWNAVEAESPLQPGAEGIPRPPGSRWGDDTAPVQQPEQVTRSPRFWALLGGIILASYVPLGLLFWYIITTPQFEGVGTTSTFLLVLVGVLQLAALIAGLMLFNRPDQRPTALGLLIGLLMADIVLPFIALCIFFGICVVQLGVVGAGIGP